MILLTWLSAGWRSQGDGFSTLGIALVLLLLRSTVGHFFHWPVAR
jgi:hypothetical protein